MYKYFTLIGLLLLLLSHTSCKKESSSGGCTDPAASNYDPNADNDDGSCEYGGSGSNTIVETWQQIDLDDESFFINTLDNISENTHQWYDFDGDGDMDFIYKNSTRIYWREMSGSTLSAAQVLLDLTGVTNSIGTAENITSFAPAELNQDGSTDFLLKVNFRSSVGSILKQDLLRAYNSGSNAFLDVKIFENQLGIENWNFRKTMDYDNDNVEEIVLANKSLSRETVEWFLIEPNQDWETIRNDTRGITAYITTDCRPGRVYQFPISIVTFEPINGVTFIGEVKRPSISLKTCDNANPFWGGGGDVFLLNVNDERPIQHTFFIDENSDHDLVYNNISEDGLVIYHDILSYSVTPFDQNSNVQSESLPFSKGVLSCMSLDHDGDGDEELIVTTPSGDDFNVEVYELTGPAGSTELNYVKTIAQNIPGKQREFAAIMSRLDVNNDGKKDIYFEVLGLVLIAQ